MGRSPQCWYRAASRHNACRLRIGLCHDLRRRWPAIGGNLACGQHGRAASSGSVSAAVRKDALTHEGPTIGCCTWRDADGTNSSLFTVQWKEVRNVVVSATSDERGYCKADYFHDQ